MKYYKNEHGDIYAYEDYANPKEGLLLITKEEADAILAQKQADCEASLTYVELRLREYPSLAEQMDMQYWDMINGTTVWKDTIEAIKLKYPKPEGV